MDVDGAKEADWGICLARTDPDKPKHDGISCFMVDMKTPGIDIRPLRELTGQAMFNEVFFDDVFVPDDCLVGQENDGWRCARTTLANERVYMGGSNTIGGGVVGVLRAIEARGRERRHARARRGRRPRRHRPRARGARLPHDVAGARPAPTRRAPRRRCASCSACSTTSGCRRSACSLDGRRTRRSTTATPAAWVGSFLFNRCLTIAGGTSDIQRNVIAERLLGLPRDP